MYYEENLLLIRLIVLSIERLELIVSTTELKNVPMGGCWTSVLISGIEAKKKKAIQYILHSLLTSIHGNCHGDKSTAVTFIKVSEINNKVAR